MKYIKYLIIVLTLTLFHVSCEREMMDYEGPEGVYFAVQYGSSWGVDATWPFMPYTPVEFFKLPGDEEIIELKVRCTGELKYYDRYFRVEVNPDSTDVELNVHYKPLPDRIIMSANSYETYIPVTLIRHSDFQKEEKRLGLKLIPTEGFTIVFEEWDAIPNMTVGTVYWEFDNTLHSLYITDFMVQPNIWIGSIDPEGFETGQWGAFSRKKLELMCEIFNLTYMDFSSTATMPSPFTTLIMNTVSKVLIEAFERGEPILEDDGRLMYMGGCPWKSYPGVAWIP
ncbi:MAG: DUF4843 domain-containing protein [Odoribacter sp.]|nr:DUF4843 domain-containing protein [Odoribacter sp.]